MVFKEVHAEPHEIYIQLKLYHDYAKAAENYNKMQTIENWEKKEKAFENYNALVHQVLSKSVA